MDDEYKQQRFPFEKFLFVVLALWLTGFVAVRIWWGHYASSQLQAQIDSARQRGQPLYWREVLPGPVPDEHNASLLYDRIVQDEGYKKIIDMRVDVPDSIGGANKVPVIRELPGNKFRGEHPELVKEVLANSSNVLAIVRQARALPHFRTAINETTSPLEIMLPTLKFYQSGSLILYIAALDAHAAGNDGQAIEYLRDAAAMARHLTESPTLISQLVAMVVSRHIQGALEEMLPSLKVGLSPAASREQVQALIAELPRVYGNAQFAKAFMYERSIGLYLGEALKEGSVDTRGWADVPITALSSFWLSRQMLRPMWDLQEARVLAHYDTKIRGILRGVTPQASTGAQTQDGEFYRIAHYLDVMWMPTLGKAVTLFYRAQAKTRMASAALAIKLYELDNGRMPDDLSDLVPRYIPAVPDDPFFPGRALGYLPKAKHPMLYTIGQDRIDDGGKCSFFVSRDGSVDEERLDTPMFLKGDRMAAMEDELGPPPATLPAGAPPGLGGFVPSDTTQPAAFPAPQAPTGACP